MGCIEELQQALGEAVLTELGAGSRYVSDKSETGRDPPRAVIRPRSVEEVATALRICHRHRQTVVPQGGMTGLAGGGNPRNADLVISLERFTGVEDIDTAAAVMTVRAGTPLESAQRAAAEQGLLLALDLGSRGSCQIGGALSTNAGGIRVIRYGMAREQVLGLEAVLADGTIVSSLNRMMKNNTGLDLKQLFIGTEGTLGVITRATLRLHPDPGPIATALCALSSYDNVVRLLRLALGRLGNVMAFEAMWRDYYQVTASLLPAPFFSGDWPFWVIVEHAGGNVRDFESFFEEALEQGIVDDTIIAQSEAHARAMWTVREGLAIETFPNLLNFDVSLPTASIGRYAETSRAALLSRWPDAHVSFYGHIGDANVHICVSTEYRAGESMHDVDEIVYGELRAFGGSISAEHGIGTLKRPYLTYSRKPEELSLMRAVKAALDPGGILNPGKVL